MAATIRRSSQNSNVYGAYGIVSSDRTKTLPMKAVWSTRRVEMEETKRKSQLKVVWKE
jgi:hypothetical protein